MCANQSNAFNEKQAVFGEIFTWLRHISNSVWLVTSFFIGLNLAVIKTVLSNLDNSQIRYFLGCLTCGERIFLAVLIYTILWLIPALCVLFMMAISAKLPSLLESGSDSLKITKLYETLGSVRLKDALEGIKFTYGWIITAFTILFLLAWIWIFFYSIP